MHESEQLRRLSPPAARAAPPASPRPFPQPDPSPQSPSSVTSLCRVLACKVAAPSVVPGRVIGQKRIDQNPGLASMRNAEWPCHVSFIGIPSSPGLSYNVLLSCLFDVELFAIFSSRQL